MGFLFWAKTGKGFARLERFAMLGGETVFINSLGMNFGAVADVFIEVVVGVFFSEFNHVTITGNFGNDRGGGDFTNLRIGFDKGGSVVCEWGPSEEIDFAVDNNLGKRCVKALDCLHGATGGKLQGF